MKKFKGILLDIDNTLYDYNLCHKYAFEQCIIWIFYNHKINKENFINAFNLSRKTINSRLKNTAASHNRLLYFQLTLEKLNLNPLKYSLDLYNCYWDNFLSIMTPFKDIDFIFEKYKNICFVTDLTVHIQHRKIIKLGLSKYSNHIVSSEEAGCEKPNKVIFDLAIDKLNLKKNEVCMIGDNFEKDILGASQNNIASIWLNTEKVNYTIPKDCLEINEINELKNFL